MMFNDMVTTINSGEMLSGTGRSQSLKNGSYPGPDSLIDDSTGDPQNFFSIMSRFSSEQTPVTTQAMKISEDQIADGKLTEEIPTDLVPGGKTKEKQVKEGGIAKRSTDTIAETMTILMEFLSASNPIRASLPVDPLSCGSVLTDAVADDVDLVDEDKQNGNDTDAIPLHQQFAKNVDASIRIGLTHAESSASGQFEIMLKNQEKVNSEDRQGTPQEPKILGGMQTEPVAVNNGKIDMSVDSVYVPSELTGLKQSSSVKETVSDAQNEKQSQGFTAISGLSASETEKMPNKAEHIGSPNEVSSVAREQSRSSESMIKKSESFFEPVEITSGDSVNVSPGLTELKQSPLVMEMGTAVRNVKQSPASTAVSGSSASETEKVPKKVEHNGSPNEVSSVAREQSRSSELMEKKGEAFIETVESSNGDSAKVPYGLTGLKQSLPVNEMGTDVRNVKQSQASTAVFRSSESKAEKVTNMAEHNGSLNEVSSVAREQSRSTASMLKKSESFFEPVDFFSGDSEKIWTGLRQRSSVTGGDIYTHNMKQSYASVEMQDSSDAVTTSILNQDNENSIHDFAISNDTTEVKILDEIDNFRPQNAESVLSVEKSTSQRVEVQFESQRIDGKQQFPDDIDFNGDNGDLLKNGDINNIKAPGESTSESQKIHKYHHNAEPLPDMASTSSSATKNTLVSSMDSHQEVSSDRQFMDSTVPEEVSSVQTDENEKTQSSKSKTAAFRSMNDVPAADGVVVNSTGSSSTADKESSHSFMMAEKPNNGERSEKDDSVQSSNMNFDDMAVNFAKEGEVAKSTRVSAASPTPQAEERAPQTEIVRQIVEKSVADIKSGRSEIRIDLKPENLGHLRLHVMTEQQQVSVKILAENVHVKEMIENQVSYIKNELQNQGINVNAVKVDLLMSGGSDFAYSQNEGSASRQSQHEAIYGGRKNHAGMMAIQEPESSAVDQTGARGGSLVNYFA